MASISVTKCHGTGNDFIIVDARAVEPLPYPAIARTLCQRRFAIGADGLLVLANAQSSDADAAMRIFNPDGSEAEMCGNGVRCVARYLYEENPERTESSIETAAGIVETKIVTWEGGPGVRVSMGEPTLRGDSGGTIDRALTIGSESASVHAVSMGNPHVVLFVTSDPGDLDVHELAATASAWEAFDTEPNVEVVQVAGDELRMRVHERGVGETWGCGSGACAAAAAAIASGRARSPLTVTTKGGSVRIVWEGPGHPIFMTGNAELIFRTDVEVPA